MAPLSTTELVARHRAENLILRRYVGQQTSAVFHVLEAQRLDASFPTLMDASRAIVDTVGATSAGLSAAYLTEHRRAAGVAGTAPIELSDAGYDIDALAESVHTQTVVSVKHNVAGNVAVDRAMGIALTNLQGVLAKHVLDFGRDIILGSTARDPAAWGYQRIIGGGGCDFCSMLAGRGAVYGKDTARFSAHNHCACSAAPVYGDTRGQAQRVADKFTPSTRTISNEQKAAVRQWLRDNPDT